MILFLPKFQNNDTLLSEERQTQINLETRSFKKIPEPKY